MKRILLYASGSLLVVGLIIFGLLSIAIDDFPIAPPERRAIGRAVRGRTFDFATWEVAALYAKARAGIGYGAALLPPEGQTQLVRDYLAVVADVRRIERELDVMFAESDDPQADSAELQQQLATQRTELRRLQPVAEGVLQTQIDEALGDAGLEVLGGTWPPVAGRMTPLPLMLIVSPRDQIEQQYAFALENGMSVADRDTLERHIYDTLDLSALVVPIGGLGIFPSMIIETGNLPFLADTYAHEWAHHWLSLRPLGFNYASSGQLRTINETTASIVGEEIGYAVLAEHYPDLLPQPVVREDEGDGADSAETPLTPEPPPFNFGLAMNATRIRVDELIAAGQLDAAEAYMEERRQLFVDNGYLIRKLNQAYFAFYGGYATTPGAQGSDPVGPAVVQLRAQSDSLADFLTTIDAVTSFEALQALIETPPAPP